MTATGILAAVSRGKARALSCNLDCPLARFERKETRELTCEFGKGGDGG